MSTHLLKGIFIDDPLFFDQMSAALSKGELILHQLSATDEDLLKRSGLNSDEIHQHLNSVQQKKIWLIKSIKERERIKLSITAAEKEKLYRGMLLTRAVDNALKQLFLSGELVYLEKTFQGKGFRSLGQEAIYGAPLFLKYGPNFLDNGSYTGDVAAPLIRDLGVFLAMSGDDIETALNAQAGKAGPPCDGRDLHLGDFSKGLLMPAAPLAIATCTLVGMALSFKKKQEARIALSFIGEGGSSLGEWHEAINFAAVHSLPMIFCIENNQIALSTPTHLQCRARSFSDKALGYGINSLIIDGNDIEDIVCAFKFAADVARAGHGPILLELNTMRMCGHAHHDDMLYLGAEPNLDFSIKKAKGGYVDQDLFEKWRVRDPIKLYEDQLIKESLLSESSVLLLKSEVKNAVADAIAVIKKRPWPRLITDDEHLVYKAPYVFLPKELKIFDAHFSKTGATFLQGISLGVKRAFIKHKNCFMVGEDIAPPYGNAFMMFKDLMGEYGHRFINSPISESAIIGACVGMALGGLIPIGEMQFNDFVACGMNQVVNNAAKLFFRLHLNVPMVLRMPYGGLRRAGPFHSQDTSPWFYRTPGLKIMAPSTPLDAMLMLLKAVDDPDPVLFYEHIALYRDPLIRQDLSWANSASIDGANLLHQGEQLTIISYGAFVHKLKQIAEKLDKNHQKTVDVIDLRYLMPIDFETLYASIKKTSRVLLVGEDIKTGGILESIATNIAQELFCYLDAPIRVLGSREIPIPYSPSLEDDYLLSEQKIMSEALKLIAF